MVSQDKKRLLATLTLALALPLSTFSIPPAPSPFSSPAHRLHKVPHGCSCEDMKDTRDLPSFSVWGKPVSGGAAMATSTTSWAITAINSVATPQTVTVDLAALGMRQAATETDVWTGAHARVAKAWTATLPPGGHRFVLLEDAKQVS